MKPEVNGQGKTEIRPFIFYRAISRRGAEAYAVGQGLEPARRTRSSSSNCAAEISGETASLSSNVAQRMTTAELARHWFESIWNRRQIEEAFNLPGTRPQAFPPLGVEVARLKLSGDPIMQGR